MYKRYLTKLFNAIEEMDNLIQAYIIITKTLVNEAKDWRRVT
jgi:hypothetical protein